MKEKGVLYLSMGTKHHARLTVSLYALRKHYGGPIAVMSPQEPAIEVLSKITDDHAIKADILIIEPARLRRNSHYVTKTLMSKYTPFKNNVFLDADTLPVKPIDDLWPYRKELFLTQFTTWISNRPPVKGRIEKWKDAAPELVVRALTKSYPAVNTGVIGFLKDDPCMTAWYDLTIKNPIFIADGIAMQLLYPNYPVMVRDDGYNCSPIYGQNKDKAVIWHFHGGKHLRSEAQPLWLPIYKECWERNIGQIRDWTPSGDESLGQFLKDHPL